MKLTIKNIYKYPSNMRTLATSDKQVIWYTQTIPRNSDFVTITNFTGDNGVGSPPSTLLYDFEYLPCADRACDSNGFNGWLQYIGTSQQQFDTVLFIDNVTWSDTNGDHNVNATDDKASHPDMKLAFYLNDHQENSDSGTKNWNVGTNTTLHEWVTMVENDCLNYRIANNSSYAVTVTGHITFGPH
jgi:hypothetical protein